MADNETVHEICERIRNRDCGLDGEAYRRDADAIEAAHEREVKHALDHGREHAEKVAAANCRDCVLRDNGETPVLREMALNCYNIACQWEADERMGVAGTTDKPEARSASEAMMEIQHQLRYGLSKTETTTGNAAKLREALRAIKDINDGRHHDAHGYEINDIIEEALAEPPRNCDVGTAEEQSDRFQKFCLSRTQPWHGCDGTCPLLMSEKCALNWAQVPYESEVNNGSK